MKSNSYFQFAKEFLRSSLLRRELNGEFDKTIFKKLAEQGFFDLRKDPKKYFSALEDLAKGSLDLPFCVSCVAQTIAIVILDRFSPSQCEGLISELANGTKLAAIANSESGAGTQLKLMKASLKKEGDDFFLSGSKECFTNGPADVVFFSAWDEKIEVFLVDGARTMQKSINSNLFGFKTGQTGSIVVENLKLDPSKDRIGQIGDGVKIFKLCFDLERLMIAICINAVLKEILVDAKQFVKNKIGSTKLRSWPQYLQEKIVHLIAISSQMDGLIQSILPSINNFTGNDLEKSHQRLSLLKYSAVEKGIEAANLCIELIGPSSLSTEHYLQKVLRDLYCLKFLGGTKELQKMVIFEDFVTEQNLNEECDERKSA